MLPHFPLDTNDSCVIAAKVCFQLLLVVLPTMNRKQSIKLY